MDVKSTEGGVDISRGIGHSPTRGKIPFVAASSPGSSFLDTFQSAKKVLTLRGSLKTVTSLNKEARLPNSIFPKR